MKKIICFVLSTVLLISMFSACDIPESEFDNSKVSGLVLLDSATVENFKVTFTDYEVSRISTKSGMSYVNFYFEVTNIGSNWDSFTSYNRYSVYVHYKDEYIYNAADSFGDNDSVEPLQTVKMKLGFFIPHEVCDDSASLELVVTYHGNFLDSEPTAAWDLREIMRMGTESESTTEESNSTTTNE